jgi:hypothetical protein
MDTFGLPLFCLAVLFGAWLLDRQIKRAQASDERRYRSPHEPWPDGAPSPPA